MPKYVLHYFDTPGRAEAARMIFHQAGVEFEDHRIKREEFPELKKNEKLLPFGELPVLEVDETVIAQSHAIYRYLANEFGLSGKTNLEKAKCDMLLDGMHDIFDKLVVAYKEQDETKKAALKKEFIDVHLPAGLKLYEAKFIPKEGFFLGKDVSFADIVFATVLDMISQIPEVNMDAFPVVKALCERVKNLPNIKKYLDSRK